MLTLKQLDKTFGAGTASAHHALCGIDLTFQDGEFVTVIGSNGGQSHTLFGAVSGSFFVIRDALRRRRDITYLPEHKRKAHCAYLQDPMRHSARSDAGGKRGARAYARAGGHLFRTALPRKSARSSASSLARLDMVWRTA